MEISKPDGEILLRDSDYLFVFYLINKQPSLISNNEPGRSPLLSIEITGGSVINVDGSFTQKLRYQDGEKSRVVLSSPDKDVPLNRAFAGEVRIRTDYASADKLTMNVSGEITDKDSIEGVIHAPNRTVTYGISGEINPVLTMKYLEEFALSRKNTVIKLMIGYQDFILHGDPYVYTQYPAYISNILENFKTGYKVYRWSETAASLLTNWTGGLYQLYGDFLFTWFGVPSYIDVIFGIAIYFGDLQRRARLYHLAPNETAAEVYGYSFENLRDFEADYSNWKPGGYLHDLWLLIEEEEQSWRNGDLTGVLASLEMQKQKLGDASLLASEIFISSIESRDTTETQAYFKTLWSFLQCESQVVDKLIEIGNRLLPDKASPLIEINSPTSDSVFSTTQAAISVSGTASDNVEITKVTWSNNRGGSGISLGTSPWSVDGLDLYSGENIITVTASDRAGNTGVDTLKVVYTPSDTIAPTIQITSPTADLEYTSTEATVKLMGTAYDNVVVTRISWETDRGSKGEAVGTDSWFADGVPLFKGENAIAVRAWDAANNYAFDTIIITYFPPADNAAPQIDIVSPTIGYSFSTDKPTINLSGTASDDVGVTLVTWKNKRNGDGNALGTTSWSVDNIALYLGENEITVTAKDAAGGACDDILIVIYKPPDTVPPDTIIMTGPIDVIKANSTAFFYSGTDDVTNSGDLVYSTYLQGLESGWSNFSNSLSRYYSNLPNGFYTFHVKAKDQTGKEDPSPAAWTFTVNGPPEDGTLKWASSLNGHTLSSPSIGVDGTIYLGSSDGYLYAVNPDGTQKWKFPTGSYVTSSPAVGWDGTIYFGTLDGNFYAINTDGTQRWAFPTGGWIRSCPALGLDGTIYFGSDDGYLYALRQDGSQKWSFKTGGFVTSSPAIGWDATVYVGSTDGCLYAVRQDGSQKWSFKTHGNVESSPAIGWDGTIYFGSGDGYFYAVGPNGTQRWVFPTGDRDGSSPAIGKDGTIYVGSSNGNVYAVRPDGTQRWVFPTGGWIGSCPALGLDGTIYISSVSESSLEGNVYAISQSGSQKWSFSTAGHNRNSPAIGSDGTIYVCESNSYAQYPRHLYALNDSSGGLAYAPWPMFHHDLTHTGRASLFITIPGDFNGDGTLSLPDAVLALQVSVGVHPNDAHFAADVNGDSKIGLPDALYILQVLSGVRVETSVDSDADGIPDQVDNCPYDHNPGQTDSDATFRDSPTLF